MSPKKKPEIVVSTSRAYAGVGSRHITGDEAKLIENLARLLSERNYVVYSGNADGADAAFQRGSNEKCLIMLPWKGFNKDVYDYNKSLDHFIFDDSDKQAMDSIKQFHPNPGAILKKRGIASLMGRNFHQIFGYWPWPTVDFVLCCADEDSSGNILGGTGQACRIAKDHKIPVINIRNKSWKRELKWLLYSE